MDWLNRLVAYFYNEGINKMIEIIYIKNYGVLQVDILFINKTFCDLYQNDSYLKIDSTNLM